MGRPVHHQRKYLGVIVVQLVIWIFCAVVVVPTFSSSVGPSSLPYTKNVHAYQPITSYQTPHVMMTNTSASAFEPRDSAGGGGNSFGGGDGYGVPAGGGGSGGYDMGGGSGAYGAPAMPMGMMYKYQIYPSMNSQGMGWGGGGDQEEEDDDDGGFDFPKELIGLLGLKGLKGLKGVVAGVKGVLLLKKALKIPLLPIILPVILPIILPLLLKILAPLLLFKLLKFLLLVALILFFPIPVGLGRRSIFEVDVGEGRNLTDFLQEKIETFMLHLPTDLQHILDKIKDRNEDVASLANVFNRNNSTSAVGTARRVPPPKWTDPSKLGDKGSPRTKITYVQGDTVANIKPSAKSTKSAKFEKNQKDINSI